MNLQYTKISDLLDRYLNVYDRKPVQASTISLSSISSHKDDVQVSSDSRVPAQASSQGAGSKSAESAKCAGNKAMLNSVAYVQAESAPAGNATKATADTKVEKSNAIIEHLTRKYKLARDDLAAEMTETTDFGAKEDQSSEFLFYPQNYAIPAVASARSVADVSTGQIFSPKPADLRPKQAPPPCCTAGTGNPDFHVQHARAERNLQPQQETAAEREPKMSLMEHQSLYAQISRLKLVNQVHAQTIADLQAENAKLKRTKKVQQKGRAKFKLLEDELDAARRRIEELEARERRLQDLVAQLRRQ